MGAHALHPALVGWGGRTTSVGLTCVFLVYGESQPTPGRGQLEMRIAVSYVLARGCSVSVLEWGCCVLVAAVKAIGLNPMFVVLLTSHGSCNSHCCVGDIVA